MAEDWLADVRRYATGADEGVVQAIVKYLGIALRNRDSSLVSFSDPKEVDRLREKFLRKKLALTDTDDVLDEGLNWVKGLMTGDRTKNRVTVYYLLAHYFGKLDLFGGPAGTSASSLAGAAALGAGVLTGSQRADPASRGSAPQARALSSVESMSSGESADRRAEPPRAAQTVTQDTTPGATQAAYSNDDDERRSAWPSWLTWLLVALAVLALFLLLRSCMADQSSTPSDAAAGDTTLAADANASAGRSVAPPEGTATGTNNVVPAGAGVVSDVVNNKPMLTVYFDSGRSEVSNQMAAATGRLKAYLASNPGRKLAVSGYNDPSGNAALNAELSKKRAQAVAAALVAAGIPQGSVELVKPSDTTTTAVTAEQARRVEVTIL